MPLNGFQVGSEGFIFYRESVSLSDSSVGLSRDALARSAVPRRQAAVPGVRWKRPLFLGTFTPGTSSVSQRAISCGVANSSGS